MKYTERVTLGEFALALAVLLTIVGCNPVPAPATPTPPPKLVALPSQPPAAPTMPAEATKPASLPTATGAAIKPADATKPTAAATPTASAKAVSVKVGVIAPLSGDSKILGESTRKGFELAVEEANKAGRVNISTVVADDKYDAVEGTNAATRLVAQDKVRAIVGPATSNVAIPVSTVAQNNKVVLIASASTDPRVTVDAGKHKDFVFRACFVDSLQGAVMAKFALNTLKARTASIMYDKSSDYSVGPSEAFRDAFEKGGGKVLSMDSYGRDDVDFSGILTKVASQRPDFLYLPDYYNKVNLIASQAREKGVRSAFGGSDAWDSSDLDRKGVDGGHYSTHYSAEATTPEVQNWVKRYQDKYKAVPDALATLAYDGTNLLVNAIVTAGSDDPTKIRDAMAATKDFKAVSGNLSFDKDGNPIKPAVVIRVKDGKDNYVDTMSP